MIVQCDFDGTITMNNLSVLLRNEFAHGEWREIEADYFRRLHTVEQSNRKQYVLIKEPKSVLVDFVRQNIEVRPGFLEFVDYCKANGIRFVVVSSGLDFYIKTVLSNVNAPTLELYCGQTSFGKNGIAVTYFDPEGNRIGSFAVEPLHTMLSNATIQHYTFSDFNDIRKQMGSFPELLQQRGR